MPIDKAVNQAPQLDIVIDNEDEMPDIEIVLEEDGSAVVNMTQDDADEVDFYANLAEVIDEDDLSQIAMDVGAMYEADKASRSDWEQMYSKGMDLLGLKIEERTKPFQGRVGRDPSNADRGHRAVPGTGV
jgi:hypothetical protein